MIVEHDISFQVERQPNSPTIQKIIGAEIARVSSNFRVDFIVLLLSADMVLIFASPSLFSSRFLSEGLAKLHDSDLTLNFRT